MSTQYQTKGHRADYFGKQNEKFDEDRFLKACGF